MSIEARAAGKGVTDCAPVVSAASSARNALRRRCGEYLVIAALFVAISGFSYGTQRASVEGRWDGAVYQAMAEQMVRGLPVRSEAPFVYRMALPWVVAKLFPADIIKGFKLLNIGAAALACLLLALWLEIAGVRSARLRVLLVLLFMAEWHGPSRFVYFAPTFVDPPLFVFLLAGSILVYSISRDYRPQKLLVLMAICHLGTLCRESMVLVPAAFLFVNNPMRSSSARRVPRYALWAPLLASCAAFVLTRTTAESIGGGYSFAGAIVQMLTSKPPFTMVLAAFVAFGPIITVLVHDWRKSATALWEQQYLAALLVGAVALAYVGGTDTERLLFWATPVVYVLLGHSLQRQRHVLSSVPLLTVLVAAQVLSCRLLWAIPDPQTAGPDLSSAPDLAAKMYAVLDRIFSFDAFYFNLWSYFADERVRVLQLITYVCCSLVLLSWMQWRHSFLTRSRRRGSLSAADAVQRA